MHVGFAVLLALVAWSAHRGAGVAFWIFAGLTQVASVVLAWHYAIDGYVSIIVVAVLYAVLIRLFRPSAAREALTPHPIPAKA